MDNVSFVKTKKELENFYNVVKESRETQEGLCLLWKTDPKILEQILPPPLVPDGFYVMAYVSYIYESDFWKDYNEGALLIPVEYKGEKFAYFLSMPIAGKNDMPIFLGRELSGFPKKNADELNILRSGDNINVSITRNGICFFNAEAEIGKFNDSEAHMVFDNYKTNIEIPGRNLNFKYDIECNNNQIGFTNVRLAAAGTTTIYHSVEEAKITNIKFSPSKDDPWAELKVFKPLGAVYYKSDVFMYPAKTIARFKDNSFAPYLLARWDSSMLGYIYRQFSITK